MQRRANSLCPNHSVRSQKCRYCQWQLLNTSNTQCLGIERVVRLSSQRQQSCRARMCKYINYINFIHFPLFSPTSANFFMNSVSFSFWLSIEKFRIEKLSKHRSYRKEHRKVYVLILPLNLFLEF